MKKKNYSLFFYAKNKYEHAFSLVEMLVTLIIVSLITAALTPVITKKLQNGTITVGSNGGGGGDGGYGGNITTDCDALAPSGKCLMCNETTCLSCTLTCNADQYKNDVNCSCNSCKDFGDKCVECSISGCTRCASGYGLLSSGGCDVNICTNGTYSDGTTTCQNCEKGYYCDGQTKKVCPVGTYSSLNAQSEADCFSCEEIANNCLVCTETACTSCKIGYSLEGSTFCRSISDTVEFTTAGTHTFTVPNGVTAITATLISGGAGGGGGAKVDKTVTFVVSGNGNVPTLDANNTVIQNSTGIHTWTIPASIKGKTVKVSACGGGGGGGWGYKGGNGGAIKDVNFLMPNQSSIKIHIGGGGGAGTNWDSSLRKGLCSLGGGGGGYTSGEYTGSASNSTSCNSGSSYSYGHYKSSGGAGYDPIYSEHGVGGGTRGSSNVNGGTGSKIGGGGGGRYYTHGSDWWANGYPCGGGGGATLFYHSEYANNSTLVASGGGGGGSNKERDHSGCGAGGGGGIGGGAGGVTGAGSNGTGSANSIFGSQYCYGGAAKSQGKSGAMRISYSDASNGGSGGGAGQIVPEQTISVNPGDILTIVVGAGGAGGSANNSGEGENEAIVSKILKGSKVLLTTATQISSGGTSGGNSNGTTTGKKGIITNGRNLTPISVSGFATTDGNASSSLIGGAGGITTIENSETHCSPGGGGSGVGVNGSNASGYGGCGGGGGGAGASGGAGACGYVKIRYTSQ